MVTILKCTVAGHSHSRSGLKVSEVAAWEPLLWVTTDMTAACLDAPAYHMSKERVAIYS